MEPAAVYAMLRHVPLSARVATMSFVDHFNPSATNSPKSTPPVNTMLKSQVLVR